MIWQRADGTRERLLGSLGLSALAERVYLVLLEHPARTVAELRAHLDCSASQVRSALKSLTRDGFVTQSDSRPTRYLPTPPDVAVDATITRRQHELYLAKHTIPHLQRLARRGGHWTGTDLLEFLSGPEAVLDRLEQLHRTARREILVFDRPPYWSARVGTDSEFDLLTRGVAARVIYDRSALDVAGQADQILRAAAAGEQARVFDQVPTKLMLIDRRAGLIPLDVNEPKVGALLIKAPALLDTFHMFFEVLWRIATPVTRTRERLLADEPGTPAATETARLLTLLASGLKDEAVARQLGISTRTLDRRIARLMRDLGAVTRFQAGWQASSKHDDCPSPTTRQTQRSLR